MGSPESSRGVGPARPRAAPSPGPSVEARGTSGGGEEIALRYTLASVRPASPPDLVELCPGDSMPEILTESFCERCGTRYTFETEAPRAKRFGKFKVLSKGLKNYVLSDETSLDEALADARSDEDRQASGQQLDAFHKTFNFCMSCRQYTCANCWNDVESRCLSCAPHLGHEVLEAPFRTPDPFARIASLTAGMASNGHEQDLEGPTIDAAWPTADLGKAPAADATPADEQIDTDAEAETDAVSRLESLFAIASRPDEPNRAPAPQPPPAPRAAPPVQQTPAVDAPPPVAAAGDATHPPAADAIAAIAADSTTGATSPAPKPTLAPARAEKPVRDIALEVSLFEEGAAQEKAETQAAAAAETAAPPRPEAPALAPRSAVGGEPTPASDAPREAVSSDPDAIDERAAAALSHTADFLSRFRSTSGLSADAAPEPVIEAATAPVVEAAPPPEPDRAVPPAAPAPLPAADPVRPQVDRIEFPTWHIDTPPAPIGQPSGQPPEPRTVPTTPGLAMQPSVQARWPEPEAPTTPSFPVPQPEPAATILPAMRQQAAITPPAAMPPAAMPPAAMPTAQPEWPATPPQWPVAPSWPSNRARAAQVSGVDAMWAASSRDVLSRAETGVQSCVNCGLPLSATARFCRRCGANQVQA
jgi:ribosomal protein L40E